MAGMLRHEDRLLCRPCLHACGLLPSLGHVNAYARSTLAASGTGRVAPGRLSPAAHEDHRKAGLFITGPSLRGILFSYHTEPLIPCQDGEFRLLCLLRNPAFANLASSFCVPAR
jgi:hypothetical protein